MGAGLLPAGQQQSLNWHVSPCKTSVVQGGKSSDATRGHPSPGKEGRAAGRLCSPLSYSSICHLSHLDLGAPDVFAGGRGRAAGACAAAVLTASQPRPHPDSGSTCSRLWIPSAPWPVTQIPATAQGFMPPASLGKAGERPLEPRGKAEARQPCVPSLLLQQMAAQGGRGHPGITFGVFWVATSFCIGWSLNSKWGQKGKACRRSLMCLCLVSPDISPKEGLVPSARSG